MKTSEFLQTVNAAIYVSKKIDVEKIILQIDQVRKLHVRLQQKLGSFVFDSYSYESQEEREKVRSISREIKEFCNEYGILSSFFRLPEKHEDFRKQFKNKIFVTYWYESVDITNLIVYHDDKTKKKNRERKSETLREIKFDENVENIKVLDEKGNDLNYLEGLE